MNLLAITWQTGGMRVGVIVVGLVIWHWTQKLIGARGMSGDGIGDRAHILSAGLHRWFVQNPKATDLWLIISSLFIDIFGLFMIGYSIFGPTFAPFLAILIVFSMRQVCQAFCTLPAPPGIIWRDPGFPSLLVTYGVSNDFFFSGHTALVVLGAIEIWHVAPLWVGIIAVLIAVCEALLMLVLRAHYTLDVVAGAFAAWFAADMAGRLAPCMDSWLKL